MTATRNTGHLLALSSIAAATAWVALTAWGPFLEIPGEFLGPLALMAAAIAVSGALLRALGAPSLVTLLVQSAVLVCGMCRNVTGSYVPDRDNLGAVGTALDAALESARNYAAPIGPEVASVAPLLLLGGALLVLLMDLLACGLRRVPLSGLVLLAVYSVPAGVPTDGSAWFSFLAAATGFLALLHLDARDRLERWGRALGPNESNQWAELNPVAEAVRAGAGRIGGVAIGVALVAPFVVPVMDLGLLGGGGGEGNDEIRIRKPIADMRRDLERPEDRPLVTVTTDDPRPEYLRVAVLNRYTGLEWSSGDRDVSSSNRADGELPAPAGVAPEVPTGAYDYEVEVEEEFESTWLPTQFPAASVTAEGDWRFDPDSMDFLASEGQTTAGIDYTMTAIEHDYGADGALFLDSAPGDVEAAFLELPNGVPGNAAFWAEQVTAGAGTDYERATRLQHWFRSEFDYSLERAPGGTGNNTLEGFLAPEGRVGYCEQFASAMAVLARSLGIPARVAVGFLRPDYNGDGTWTYSSHDLHAWPELYFSGTGWVRFEPTPAGRAGDVPAYSALPDDGTGNDPGNVGATDQPTAAPDQQDPAGVAPTAPGPTDTADTADTEGGLGTTPRILLAAALAAVVLVLLLGPRWVRGRWRERRLARGPESAWEELWAATADLDLAWPEQRSPREIGETLAAQVDDEAATAALGRIVGAVEQARYAPAHRRSTSDGVLAEDVTTAVAALTGTATARARRRATWMPRSIVRKPPRNPAVSDREPVPLGG